jgi:large subunit ribosomal protein L10
MKREDKASIINELAQKLQDSSHFYLTDIADLNAEESSNLRRKCFEKEIELIVVKNTMLKKAMEQLETDYSEMYDVMKGATSIMFTETGNIPGKLIKELRKKHEKPIVKAAYVEETVYIGDDQLEALANIKSKNELIADVIGLLQSPAKNVVSALQSSGQTLTGVLKTLSERE